jgi:hypothetical protein
MTTDEREINRKRRILEHADVSGNVAKTCREWKVLCLFSMNFAR